MNKGAIIFWGNLVIWCIIISIVSIGMAKSCSNTNNNSIEEMYHKQLVITLDSILDARFGTGCCEEVIDSDDVSIPSRYFQPSMIE